MTGTAPPPRGYRLRVLGLAGFTIGLNPDGSPVGRLVKRLDVDAYEGRGELLVTDDPEQAATFPTFADAWEAWQQQSTRRPLRPDGQPNRPGTAYTVAVEPVP